MKREEYHSSGVRMDYSSIDTRFEKYYDSGERVEVTWKDGYEDFTGYGNKNNGKKTRFYIGKSTGWRPIFLQLIKCNSLGGVAICSAGVESIRGLGIYRY